MEGPGSPDVQPMEGAAAMRWLMRAFCDREMLRQKLALNGSEQLLALETFAAEVAMGAAPDSDSLAVCVGEVAPQLSTAALSDCIAKMRPHPLLSRAAAFDSWAWSQEQIGHVFLAEWVRQRTSGGEPGQRSLRAFLAKQRLSPSQMTDLASMLVDLATDAAPSSDVHADVGNVVKQILRAAGLTLMRLEQGWSRLGDDHRDEGSRQVQARWNCPQG